MALANLTQEETNAYNRDHCKSIAEDLDKIANGYIYRNEDGEKVDASDLDEIPEDWEIVTMLDYFEDVYNARFVLDSNLHYWAVKLMVACGGPNIWVNTESENVELFWWGDHASYPLSRDAVYAIDDFARDWYEMSQPC